MCSIVFCDVVYVFSHKLNFNDEIINLESWSLGNGPIFFFSFIFSICWCVWDGEKGQWSVSPSFSLSLFSFSKKHIQMFVLSPPDKPYFPIKRHKQILYFVFSVGKIKEESKRISPTHPPHKTTTKHNRKMWQPNKTTWLTIGWFNW